MKSRALSESLTRCKSKQHKKIYKQLKEFFPNYRIYNEIPYKKILGVNCNSKLRADIFVKEPKLIIEVMGEQHFKPVAFGGDDEEAERRYRIQRRNDEQKRKLIRESEYVSLLEIPFDVSVGGQTAWLSILIAITEDQGVYKLEKGDENIPFFLVKVGSDEGSSSGEGGL